MTGAARCWATSPSGARCTGDYGHDGVHFDAQRVTSWSDRPAAAPCSCDEALALRRRVTELETERDKARDLAGELAAKLIASEGRAIIAERKAFS